MPSDQTAAEVAAATTVPALVDSFAAGQQLLVEHLLAIVRAIVGSFTGWYTTTDITGMVQMLVPQIEAAQEQVGALTNAYLAQVTTELTGRTVPPASATVDPMTLRTGTTHGAAYGRLADNYRYLRTEGASEQQALERTLERAQVMAETDTSLAMRDQTHLFLIRNTDTVTGYRRVLRPELSAHGSCGLCIAASDRIYHVAELMPLHARCNCVPTPIVNSIDPGRSLNGTDLAQLYAAAGSTAAADLKRVRVAVRHNGELGPVLARADWDHRGPADVAAASAHAA